MHYRATVQAALKNSWPARQTRQAAGQQCFPSLARQHCPYSTPNANTPSLARRVSVAGVLLAGLLCAGCNHAASDGGVAAQPTGTVIPDSEAELRDRIDQVRAV